jgi:pilus assembly protein Flp/PilA
LRTIGSGGTHAWHTRCHWTCRDAARGRDVQNKRGASPHHRTAPASGATHPVMGRMTMQLVNTVKSFVRNEEGQDLLEYALLVALIALVAIAAVTAAGGSVSKIFQSIADKLVAPA